MIGRLFVLANCLFPAICWAQGNESTTAAEDTESGAAVQIGAGSTSAVTTGSSGPDQGGDETVPPMAPSFSITPEEETVLGPGMLTIQVPDRLRCDLIADESARRNCTAAYTPNSARSGND